PKGGRALCPGPGRAESGRRPGPPGADRVDSTAAHLGDEPAAVRGEAEACRNHSGRLPNALAGGCVVNSGPPRGIFKSVEHNPATVRADVAIAHAGAGLHAARLGGIRVQNPAAALHAIADPHGLGDHPAVAARRDLAVSWMEWQALRGTDEQAARVRRVRSHRPAEEALEAVGKQAACPVKTYRRVAIIADRQVSQLASGLRVKEGHAIR